MYDEVKDKWNQQLYSFINNVCSIDYTITTNNFINWSVGQLTNKSNNNNDNDKNVEIINESHKNKNGNDKRIV